MNLQEIVAFRREQLFEGAVQISWFYHDYARAKQAATSFVPTTASPNRIWTRPAIIG